MPPNLDLPGNYYKQPIPFDITGQNHDYAYPLGIDLRPGSEAHEAIVDLVMDRVRESHGEMSKRYDSWRKMDDSLTAYVALNEEEWEVQEEDDRKPVRVLIPSSLAVLDTFCTYWMASQAESPLFRYEGVGPEDVYGAALLEGVVDLQAVRNKHALSLYTMFRDSFAYGIGALSPVWDIKRGFRTVIEPDYIVDPFANEPIEIGSRRTAVEDILFEGNRLDKIHPSQLFLDPNYSCDDVQRSEYVGWITRDNYMSLLSREGDPESGIFNMKYLRKTDLRSRYYDRDISYANERITQRALGDTRLSTTADVIIMCVTIIPEEHKLTEYDRPEKWLFALAGERYVIMAQPLGLDHDMYPIAICAPNTDGYSTLPISLLEAVYPMQQACDWMVSMFFANIRKALNDMFIVDPWMVNIDDVMDPRPGKIIRLNRHAFGRSLRDAIQQFPVSDVTQSNINNLAVFIDLISRVTGATDVVQGIRRRGGERISATESENDRSGAMSRMIKSARLGSMQAIQDLAIMVAAQTQQFMTSQAWVKAVGRWREIYQREAGPSAQYVPVTPDQLTVAYDVVPNDGTIPSASNANAWKEILGMVTADPLLNSQYDSGKILAYIARILGAKNIDDFRRLVPLLGGAIAPDQAIAQQAQAGNVVPLQEYANASTKPVL